MADQESDLATFKNRLFQSFCQKTKDTRYLLDWVLSEMPRLDDPDRDSSGPVPDSVLEAVNNAEMSIRAVDSNGGEGAQNWQDKVVPLDEALRTLSAISAPVSIETLRATYTPTNGKSRVQNFFYLLIAVTVLSMLTVVTTEVVLSYAVSFWPTSDSEDAYSSCWYYFLLFLEQLEPFTYGALGASAFLLRSAKKYMTKRDFDIHRKNEYLARFALGIVSGGAAALLVETINVGGGDTVELSKAVIGFLGGYSTEFLFKLVERLLEAILPKVDATSPRARRPGIAEMAGGALPASTIQTLLPNLLDRLKATQDADEKAALLDLIKSINSRIGSS